MWKDHSPWQIYTNRIRDLHEFFLKLANMVWSLEKNPTENHEFPRFQLPFVGSLIWLFLLVWIQVFIPMAFLQYMEKYSMLMSTEIFLNSFEIFHICIRDWPEIGPRSVTVYTPHTQTENFCKKTFATWQRTKAKSLNANDIT